MREAPACHPQAPVLLVSPQGPSLRLSLPPPTPSPSLKVSISQFVSLLSPFLGPLSLP